MPNVVAEGLYEGLRVEPLLTISEWADRYRILSSKASAEPGRWRTDRTPYLREIMDCLSPHHPAQRIVFMAGAQVGKTECGNNWIGYTIQHSPCPMLMVQPTVEVAKRVSKQRIAPMIEATPSLRARVKEARTRDAGNTTFVKEFDGGLLIMTGANSSAGLRSMPIGRLFLDEIDEYPGDLDGQGDPVVIAEKRTATFARRKTFATSTPTIAGLSRIEREYLATDQRRFFVPCPECGAFDFIRWENIRWTDNDPDTAELACVHCGALIEERHKATMLPRGEWRATAKGDGRSVGFHLSSLYSPLGWKSWADCVAEFLTSKGDPFRFRAWVNTVLGETWEERGAAVDADTLKARAEDYPAEVPDGVGILTAGIDVQGDRLEVAVKGWGASEESWLIAWTQLLGDPGSETVWHDLTRFLALKYKTRTGREVAIDCACIDSGGHHTEQVYRYAKAHVGRRVFAVKGSGLRGIPLVSRPSHHNRYRVKLFILGVDTAKDLIMSRLRIGTKGPGFIHLPSWVDDEYLAQLTSERSVVKYIPGKGSVRSWVKTRERNEALDLEVYALAALHVLGPAIVRTLPERAAKVALDPQGPPPSQAQGPESPAIATARALGLRAPSRKARGWMSGIG